jgi:hypothetical protein
MLLRDTISLRLVSWNVRQWTTALLCVVQLHLLAALRSQTLCCFMEGLFVVASRSTAAVFGSFVVPSFKDGQTDSAAASVPGRLTTAAGH